MNDPKNKKKLIIIVIAILLIIVSIILAYFFHNFKNDNSLTLEENKWIDSNKYNVIDIAVVSDIPLISYDGQGIIYDYLNYITQEQSLKFNIIPYKLDSDVDYDYKIDILDNVKEDDIVLLKDNLVLLTVNNTEYLDVNDINNLKIGVISSDNPILTSYFENKSIEFVNYETYSDLKQSFIEASINVKSGISANIDAIIIPKSVFTKEIIENDYKISFHINDLNKYFVLDMNGSKELNSIMKKYFNIWDSANYKNSYNSALLSNYFNN